MNDELKKKLEQLIADNDFREGYSSPYYMDEIGSFKMGFEAAHDLMKKDYEAKVQKLVDQVREYADWNHAPRLEEALAEFEK